MMKDNRGLFSFVNRVNPGAYVNAGISHCEGLSRIAKPIGYPVNVDVVLTKACNLRCAFCISYGSLKDERWMSFDLYERIARELFPRAHGLFICSGGEPFLYPRLRDALKLALHFRTRTTVTSNGTLIDREAAQWLVQDQSLDELCISFDGSRKETLERIRRGAKYETILGNLEYLSHLKKRAAALYPRMWFRFVVMKSNAMELPEMLDICARYGLYKVVVKYLNVANDMDPDESLLSHPDLAAQAFSEARVKARERRVRVVLPPLPGRQAGAKRCFSPWNFVQIDTDGSLRFCYSGWRQRLGFFDDGFRSIWRGEHYQRIRSTLYSSAPYFPYCRHCLIQEGYGTQAARDEVGPDAYVIPGLERWQVPFTDRRDENVSSFRELATSASAKSSPH
jgi:MoaA/NifB/PqqE/SkfB family radical SAM enzyme